MGDDDRSTEATGGGAAGAADENGTVGADRAARPLFNPVVTGIVGVVVLLLFWQSQSYRFEFEAADYLHYPAQSAIVYVESDLDDLENLRRAATLERWIYGGPFFDLEEHAARTFKEGDKIYRAIEDRLHPYDERADIARLRAHHAVLLAESGKWSAGLERALDARKNLKDLDFARTFYLAYPSLPRQEGVEPANGAEAAALRQDPPLLDGGWARARMLQRLGDAPRYDNPHSTYRRFVLLMAASWILLFVGLGALIFLARRGAGATPPGDPPLRGWLAAHRAGLPMFLRAYGYGELLFMMLGYAFFLPGFNVLWHLSSLVHGVPLLWLLGRHLLDGGKADPETYFPSRLPGGIGQLALLVLAATAVSSIGRWVITWAGGAVGVEAPGLEGFVDVLLFAPVIERVANGLNMVVFAPFFEELLYRGILFSALRTRYSFATSAVVSSALFSAVHGYSWIGSVDIFWIGFIYAWLYERTGSLAPGMACHALHNALVSAWMLGYA